MPSQRRIAVIGGRSAVATQLRAGPFPCADYIVRSAPRAGEIYVSDYHEITSDILEGYEAVINCTGATSGSPEDLYHVNATLVKRLALASRSAGVRRFVHISSFSTLGHVETVDVQTPSRPTSSYGQSKLAGDETLLATAAPGFAVTAVRLPAIVDPQGHGKVERLVRYWRAARVMPVPNSDVRRTMISSMLAAEAMARAANDDVGGIRYAGDPQPFTFKDAAAAISLGSRRTVIELPLPVAVLHTLRMAAPSIHRSLYTDCILAPEANLLGDATSDIMPTIARIAAAKR